MTKQAITTAATMISISCAMPIAVMIESSENTMSMTMIWTITQKNALALRLASSSPPRAPRPRHEFRGSPSRSGTARRRSG